MTMGPTESVILVDESDGETGVEERWAAHRGGLLHRAVSVFVFNGSGELLLQRRADTKRPFAGVWANTCCTHPWPGETVIAAGQRRLVEEMGLVVDLDAVGSFHYKAVDQVSGLTEHELDHVVVGHSSAEPKTDATQVDGIRWVDVSRLRRELSGDDDYAPWLSHALHAFPDLGLPVSRPGGA